MVELYDDQEYNENYEELEDKLEDKPVYDFNLSDESTNPFVQKFQYFFDRYYKTTLEKLIQDYPIKKSLNVDFELIEQFDPSLADELIDNPDYILEAMLLASQKSKSSLLGEDKTFEPYIRIVNLPKDKRVMIKYLSSRHIGKFVCIEGLVKQFTTVMPKLKKARFVCGKCGHELDLAQEGIDVIRPKMCPECKHKAFILDENNSEFIDYQKLEVQDLLENLRGGEQSSTINIYVQGDLVNTFTAGERLIISGILRLRNPKEMKQTVFGQYILCSSIESSKQDYENIEITKEDEEKLKELSQNPEIYNMLIDSVAPHISGHKEIKEGVILQLFGGVRKILDNKSKIRGNIHILVVGDPGVGKCLHPESKILLTNNKLQTIEHLFNNLEKKQDKKDSSKYYLKDKLELFAINLDGKIIKVKPNIIWKRKPLEKMLEIKTFSGNTLRLTENHPLFVHENGFVKEKYAGLLNLGEYIVGLNKLPIVEKETYFLDKKLNKNLARLFGYVIGDGYINYTKSSGLINFTSINKETIDDFSNIIKTEFNYGVKKYTKKETKALRLEFYNKKLIEDIDKIYPCLLEKSENKRIPDFILESKREIFVDFLKALFECDSYFDKSNKIIYTSKSKDLIDGVRVLLLKLGIISIVRDRLKYATNTKSKIKQKYYDLIISGEDSIKFVSEVGIITKGKSFRKNIKTNSNYKLVPDIGKLFKELRFKHSIKLKDLEVSLGTYRNIENEKKLPNYNTCIKIITAFKKLRIKDDLLKRIEDLLNSDIFWDKIVSIKEINNVEYVYDFQIPKYHNYIADFNIVHNSQILLAASKIAPKSIYIVGKTASGAGLTASAVKDEFGEGGWTLKAGALVLASGGFAMVDEFDKMDAEDRSAMHEALEQETVSIAKAGIVTSFKTETSVLAAANPKFGRFNAYKTLPEQIEVPPTLMSRFDLFFILQDVVDEKKDMDTVSSIIKTHKTGALLQKQGYSNLSEKDKTALEKINTTPSLDVELIRKYISYARLRVFPVLSENAGKILQKFFIGLRQKSQGGAVTVTFRQLEALIRLAEASARVRLSDKVLEEDVDRALKLYKKSMEQVGMDPETGEMDIDIITTGQSHSQSNKLMKVLDIIKKLSASGEGSAKLDDIYKDAELENIDKNKTRELIEKLQKVGDIYEPRTHQYKPSQKD